MNTLTPVLIVSPNMSELANFITALTNSCEVMPIQTDNRTDALAAIKTEKPALVIIDSRLEGDHGAGLTRDILKISALTTIAILDDAPEKEFEEATEGLGVLMQLPLICGTQQAEIVWSRYRQLL